MLGDYSVTIYLRHPKKGNQTDRLSGVKATDKMLSIWKNTGTILMRPFRGIF